MCRMPSDVARFEWGREGQKHGQGCKERVVQESESGRSEKVLLLSEDRSRKVSMQNETERPCRCRTETSDCKLSNDTAAVVPLHCALSDEHAMTCHVEMPRVERKTLGEDVNVERMMRSDAGSTAPTGRERVKLTYAIPTCETFLMWDKVCGGGICPRGSDQTAQEDTTAATMQLVTAPDDPVHGNVGKSNTMKVT